MVRTLTAISRSNASWRARYTTLDPPDAIGTASVQPIERKGSTGPWRRLPGMGVIMPQAWPGMAPTLDPSRRELTKRAGGPWARRGRPG